jgi:outer membrane autotransporter protein
VLGSLCEVPASAFGEAAQGGALAAASGGSGASGGDGRLGTWAAGTVRSGQYDGRGTAAGTEFESDGVSAGVDYRFSPQWVLGAGLGYGRDENAVGGQGSRLDGEARALAVYGSWQPGSGWFVDGLVGYQWLDYALYRRAGAATVRGDREGRQWFGSLTAGADITRGAWRITPYGRVEGTQADLSAYVEGGDPSQVLRYEAMAVETTTVSAGLDVAYQQTLDWGVFQPHLRLEYQHDLDATAAAVIRYADNLGPFYRTNLTGFERERFVLGIGALFQTLGQWTIRPEYRSTLDGDDRDNSLMITVERQY